MSVMPQTFIWFIGNTPFLRFFHGLPAELSAGGVDISTQAPPHGGGDAVGFQPFLKGPDPAGGLVGALHHVVQGNQIHVARHPRSFLAIRSACQSWSLTPSIMAYSKEMRRPVLSK